MRTRVLIVGQTRHEEFASGVARLAQRADVSYFTAPADALHWLASDPDHGPELILLAQARPGEMTAAVVEQLHRAAPLARLAVLLGSWCEGELRTGRPWPGVMRIAWHQMDRRLRHSFRVAALSAGWNLPRTASEADRVLWEIDTVPLPRLAVRVAIHTFSRATFEAIADGLCAAGGEPVWWRASESPAPADVAAIVWDFPHGGRSQYVELAACRQAIRAQGRDPHTLTWIALLGFPRRQDMEQLRSHGITRCLAKPYQLGELLDTLSG